MSVEAYSAASLPRRREGHVCLSCAPRPETSALYCSSPRTKAGEGIVEDPVKAELMAYASKSNEELVVSSRRMAKEAMVHMGDISPIMSQQAEIDAINQAGAAETARKEADRLAQIAGDIYEKIKKL